VRLKMEFDFKFMLTAVWSGIGAIPATLQIAILPVIIGTVIGLPIALVRFFEVRILSGVFKWIVTVVRGIPVVLIMMIAYIYTASAYDSFWKSLGIPLYFRDLDKAIIAVISLSVVATAVLSEIFRGSLAAVKKGQFDASYSVGLSKTQTLYRIVLPQVLPISIPMLCNVLIGMLKAAALASLVSVIDVLNASLISATGNYKYLEAYVAAALVYWGLSLAIEFIFKLAERSTGKKIREPVNLLSFGGSRA